jgi:hypothetical protein
MLLFVKCGLSPRVGWLEASIRQNTKPNHKREINKIISESKSALVNAPCEAQERQKERCLFAISSSLSSHSQQWARNEEADNKK